MNVKWNVLPFPGVLSAQIRPPISSTSFLLMARPRPFPPYLRDVEASAWEKGWKSLPMASEDMPMPLSLTLMYISNLSSPYSLTWDLTSIPPRSVNFTALESRLTRTCRTLDWSASMISENSSSEI